VLVASVAVCLWCGRAGWWARIRSLFWAEVGPGTVLLGVDSVDAGRPRCLLLWWALVRRLCLRTRRRTCCLEVARVLGLVCGLRWGPARKERCRRDLSCHEQQRDSVSKLVTRSGDSSPSLTSAAASMTGGKAAAVAAFALHRGKRDCD
jgi:hypothetical protein